MNQHFRSKWVCALLWCACLSGVHHGIARGESGKSAGKTGVGYVRFVNAVGLGGRLTISMNGDAVNKIGYAAGAFTGGVGLSSGGYDFTFDHPAAESLELGVTVIDGESAIYVIYAEPKLDKDGNVTGNALAVQKLESEDHGGASVTAVSLCASRDLLPLEMMVEGGKRAVEIGLVPFEPRKIDLPRGGDFALAFKRKVVASMTMAEPGHFAVVLFEVPFGKDGATVKAAMFMNEKFSGRN